MTDEVSSCGEYAMLYDCGMQKSLVLREVIYTVTTHMQAEQVHYTNLFDCFDAKAVKRALRIAMILHTIPGRYCV